MMTKTECKHPGYRMVEGALACVDCGTASASPAWQANVYGVEEAKRLHSPIEDKALHGAVEEKPYSPIVPPGQRNRARLAGRR